MHWIKKLKNVSVEYDTDYGVDKRSGWSICVNGSFTAELEPSLIRAIWQTVRRVRQWEW